MHIVSWYFEVSRLCREIRRKAYDALEKLREGDADAVQVISGYLKTDYKNLHRIWSERFSEHELGYLGRHINFGMENDYHDILTRDVPSIEEKAESHFQVAIKEPRAIGIENLLHPVVLEHAYQHYTNGHLRDAVLNAFIAVFDLIRDRTGSELDGAKLATQIFSVNNPQLVFSETNTDSGRNDQTGFLRIFEGAYIGIRNPKAHTLQHDLTENTAAQYLVFASLLARRVSEATKP